MNADKLDIKYRKSDSAQPNDQRSGADRVAAQCEEYAAALAAHFQTYVDWANDHWPLNETAFDPKCFDRSREDLAAIRQQLGLPAIDNNTDPSKPGAAQFIPVAPMPWP
jgi:hypothetical protein